MKIFFHAKIQILMIRKIKETCLYVNNLEETGDFYLNVLGFDLISEKKGRHVFFRVGEEVLLCFNPEVTKHDKYLPPHFAVGQQHVAFEVDQVNYETVKRNLMHSGVKILHEETWRDHVKSFYFHDPSHHLLEIVGEGLWDV